MGFVALLVWSFATNAYVTQTVETTTRSRYTTGTTIQQQQRLVHTNTNTTNTNTNTTTKSRNGRPSLRKDRNRWKRLQPQHGGTVYGDHDDFRIGKSCHWRRRHAAMMFFSKPYYWDCRDCGSFTNEWRDCRVLTPRGKCPRFAFQDWDGPRPRSASTYNPDSPSPYPVRVLTSYGVGKVRQVEYEQAQCDMTMTSTCFDMNKCTTPNAKPTNGNNSSTSSNNSSFVFSQVLAMPIAVYAYPGTAPKDLKKALTPQTSSYYWTTTSPKIRQVQDPSEACLLIVYHKDVQEAMQSASWNGGRNHYVYNILRPIGDINYELASLGSVVATEAQLRWGYDIPLPLPALWSPPVAPAQTTTDVRDDSESPLPLKLELHRPRRLLLSFRGSVQDTIQPYYQHRWLAAEYLYGDPNTNVEIDVQCKHKTALFGELKTIRPYDDVSTFDDLMVNATFGFCPGGSHVTSFRFTEVLSVGGIPVVLPEVVEPFAPELDWSKCVVRVSQARIVDLPRILMAISPEQVRQRQVECQRLYQFIRNEPGKALGLVTTLKVWVIRIQQAVQAAQLRAELNADDTLD
jgi:hypothetical protein